MKQFINNGSSSHDIVHLNANKDVYDSIELNNNNQLVLTSESAQRQYLIKDVEDLTFFDNDTSSTRKFKYIDLVNEYGFRRSCLEILNNNSEAQSGIYTIKPDGINQHTVYCDMSEGWTLAFSYDTSDHNSVDESEFPTISDSRDKLLSKVWGMTDNLYGSGHRIGNLFPRFKDYITNGSTQVMAEVARVDNDARIKAERFEIQDKNFIDRVHSGNQMDCWTSVDGDTRLIIANYLSPGYTYNRTLKAGCGLPANSQAVVNSNMVASGNWGIDGALIMSEEGNNNYSNYDKDLTIHVNWYGDRNTQDLYNNTTSGTQTKWGVSGIWYPDAYGRSGDTPGPMICISECGYTNQVQNMFKFKMWIK